MSKQIQRADGGAAPTHSQNDTRNWLTPRGGRSTPGKHLVPIWVDLRAGPDEHGKPHQHKPGPSAVSKLEAFNKAESGKRPCECQWYYAQHCEKFLSYRKFRPHGDSSPVPYRP